MYERVFSLISINTSIKGLFAQVGSMSQEARIKVLHVRAHELKYMK